MRQVLGGAEGPDADITSGELNKATGDSASLVREKGCGNCAAEIENYKENLEELLNTLGEDGTLANYDLQNATQRQQACIQLMSGLSKMFSETIMSIIRKFGS